MIITNKFIPFLEEFKTGSGDIGYYAHISPKITETITGFTEKQAEYYLAFAVKVIFNDDISGKVKNDK
jgi:hypothetical protein